MAARSSSSAAAALFLATILLLAATSALAQAPAPSSLCPSGLDQLLGDLLQPVELLTEIVSALWGLEMGTAIECVCSVAQGSTGVAEDMLTSLGLGSLGWGLDCSSNA